MSDLIDDEAGKTIFVVERKRHSSSDFFVLPAISGRGHRVVRCGHDNLPSRSDLSGAVVIFVRYVPDRWRRLVDAVRSQLASLVLFIDDDLLDMHAASGMPLRYRFMLARLAAWRTGWLRKQGVELWVSSKYLFDKYADWGPKLILPSPVAIPSGSKRIFYHGSVATHQAEIRWLRPIIEEVLRRNDNLAFEIVGDRDVWQLYKGLPRVNVVHTMEWQAYRYFLAMPGRHIGLAPLLDNPFNHARSCTKFFDFTSCGAVGIFSHCSIYSDIVSHNVNGLLVEMDQVQWVDAIDNLAKDESQRLKLFENAETKIRELELNSKPPI